MWKYTGKGFVPGVPARDLTDEEMKTYRVEESGLYERVPEPRKPARGKGESQR